MVIYIYIYVYKWLRNLKAEDTLSVLRYLLQAANEYRRW